MIDILDLILSLWWATDSLKKDDSFYNEDAKETKSNQDDEKWEDFIQDDEEGK